MRRPWILLVVLLLAGCGGGTDETSDEGTPLQTIQLTLTEFAISPATVNLPQADTYEFEVSNDGQLTHALDIEAEGDAGEAETGNIDPGESRTVSITLPGGSHEMYCPIGNHRDQGMEGTITVAGGAGGGTTTDETETENETEGTTTDDDPGY
jgi:plastocyanin